MRQYEMMVNGRLYVNSDSELREMRKKAQQLCHEFNMLPETEKDSRMALIRELFAYAGSGCNIHTRFRCDYGSNIRVGDNFFANYDCIFLDVAPITIGDNVMFGPRVSLYTALHPTDPLVRNEGLEYGLPISIGDNVWFGGSVVVNPGVSIGSNSIIGSGSVVTKDIPDNVIAVGNPCRVLREITEEDHLYWEGRKLEDYPSGVQ